MNAFIKISWFGNEKEYKYILQHIQFLRKSVIALLTAKDRPFSIGIKFAIGGGIEILTK